MTREVNKQRRMVSKLLAAKEAARKAHTEAFWKLHDLELLQERENHLETKAPVKIVDDDEGGYALEVINSGGCWLKTAPSRGSLLKFAQKHGLPIQNQDS